MQTRLLSEAEYDATFALPMKNVMGQIIDVLDIWPYVASIPPEDLQGHEVWDRFVESVYRNGSHTVDHVLVCTKTANVFLAVLIDLAADKVMGHRLLDLKEKFGLESEGGPA